MYWLDPDTSFKLNVFCHLEMSLESPFSDVSLRNPNIAQVFLSQYLNSWTCLTDKAWPILPFSPLESERNDISRFENGDCTRTRSRVPWLFRVQPKHQKRLSPDADNRKYAQTRLRKPIGVGFRSRFSQCVDYMRFNEKSFCFRWQETTKLNTKTSSLVLLCDLRYLTVNISSVMTKHMGVQRKLHRFAYLIVQIILWFYS